MSILKELNEIAKDAEKKKKEAIGINEQLASDWENIVKSYEDIVRKSAAKGNFKEFFDTENHNIKTVNKIAIKLKEVLGDVIITVSPRGIEADWGISD
jgi:hypothetical protein